MNTLSRILRRLAAIAAVAGLVIGALAAASAVNGGGAAVLVLLQVPAGLLWALSWALDCLARVVLWGVNKDSAHIRASYRAVSKISREPKRPECAKKTACANRCI